jgi:hypothetical protein
VNAIYEYIIATIIVVMLVGWTYYSSSSSTLVAIGRIEDEQLKVVAQEVFNKLLLTPGDPVNWTSTTVKSLGLADMNAQEAFTLDRDKVLMLRNGSIGISRARDLMGLENNYDFSLSVTPALNITVIPNGITYDGNHNHNFTVVVRDLRGLPSSSASITGYYVNNTSTWNIGDNISRSSKTTGTDGLVTLSFKNLHPQDVTLLIMIKAFPSSLAVLKTCYVQGSSDTTCSSMNPPKLLKVVGDYVIEGLPQSDEFVLPSPRPPGGLNMVTMDLFVTVDGYAYRAEMFFWRTSE